jgi:hypothetical protein
MCVEKHKKNDVQKYDKKSQDKKQKSENVMNLSNKGETLK